MASEHEIAQRFWKALRSDRVVLLGLPGVEGGHSQPMTAQVGTDDGPGLLWFFSSRDTDFVRQLGNGSHAVAHFAAKGHDLFASLDGILVPFNDRDMIDRLWNPHVAAWFNDGKDDPSVQLLRLEPRRLQVWLNEGSLLAGMKQLFGGDPKKNYEGRMVDLELPPRIA
jgi:general stress protein 26